MIPSPDWKQSIRWKIFQEGGGQEYIDNIGSIGGGSGRILNGGDCGSSHFLLLGKTVIVGE